MTSALRTGISDGIELAPPEPLHLGKPTVDELRSRLTRYPYFCKVDTAGRTDRSVGTLLTQGLATASSARAADSAYVTAQRVSFTAVRIQPTKAGPGMTADSRTNRAMGLHTDSSYSPRPHEIVAFHVIRPDTEGGDSLMVTADDVVAALPEEVLQLLRQPVFPFGRGQVFPILSSSPEGETIRYYRKQVELDGQGLDAAALAALDALDAVLDDPSRQFRFRVEAGEILFMHNHRVLHGRTGFSADSQRLMYRYRAHADQL